MWEVILKASIAIFVAGLTGLLVGEFAYLTRPKAFHKLSKKERKEILGLERALSGSLDPDFDVVEFAKDAFNAVRGIHHDIEEITNDVEIDADDITADVKQDTDMLEEAAQIDSEEGTDK